MTNTDSPSACPAPSGEPVGLIGVGLMGSAMVERLVGGGVQVLGWSRSPDSRATLEKLGGKVLNDAGEVFRRCDRVFLSLFDSKVTKELLQQHEAALRAGQIVMDTATGDPQDAVTLSRMMAKHGVIYLDATISGNSDQLRRKEVLVMVGGPRDAFQKCEPLFQFFARKAMHTGDCGSGAMMKLVTNLVLGLNRAALAEGLVFAHLLGLDGALSLAVLKESMAYSRMMDVKGEKMLKGDFTPQARLSQHLKDVRLMIDAAAAAGARLPLSETHRHILELAEEAGLGQMDNSALIRAIEQMKGPAK